MSLSLLIVAHNEEEFLGGCIDHIRDLVGQVVVVVQQSTDRTLEIALEKADVVIEHPVMGSCEFSRLDGIDACTGEWVLQLDADERLSEYGKKRLPELLRNPQAACYGLRRLTTVDGVTIEDAHQYRLIRPQAWDRVHNRMHSGLHPRDGIPVWIVDGPVFIEHFKSGARQQAQHERYQRWGYLKTEIRPEWAEVPWRVRHKG